MVAVVATMMMAPLDDDGDDGDDVSDLDDQ